MPPLSVLLMDNDPNYLRLAMRFLQHRDDVVVFSSAHSELQKDTSVPMVSPDLVFYSMGNHLEAGLQVIVQIRSNWPDVHLIVLARWEHQQYRQDVLLLGADDFMIRPQIPVDALPIIWRRISHHRVRKLSGSSRVHNLPNQSAFDH